VARPYQRRIIRGQHSAVGEVFKRCVEPRRVRSERLRIYTQANLILNGKRGNAPDHNLGHNKEGLKSYIVTRPAAKWLGDRTGEGSSLISLHRKREEKKQKMKIIMNLLRPSGNLPVQERMKKGGGLNRDIKHNG